MEERRKRRVNPFIAIGPLLVLGGIGALIWAVKRDDLGRPGDPIPFGDLRFAVQKCIRENVRELTQYKIRVLIINKGKERLKLDSTMVRAYQPSDDTPLLPRPDMNKGVFGFAPDRGFAVDVLPGEKNISWYVFTGPPDLQNVRVRFFPRGDFGEMLDSLTVGRIHVDVSADRL